MRKIYIKQGSGDNKNDRRTEAGFKRYWTEYPYHFEEMYGMPLTDQNIQKAMREMSEPKIKKLLIDWSTNVTLESFSKIAPTYSLNRQQ